MVRPPYADRPVPQEAVRRYLANAQKAPTAGFSQGFAFAVLQGDETEIFWRHTQPDTRPEDRPRVPVLILPLEHKQAYLDRYSQPDKAGTGMHEESAWPVPYWTVDTAFASMIILLSATAEGIGGWFFGIFAGERELLTELGVPDGYHPIGAIALGYPSPEEYRSPSLKRGRKPLEDIVHWGRWRGTEQP